MKNIFKIQFFLFMTLLLLWNIFTPVLEGADEQGHFCHAEYITYRQKLPNLNIPDGCFLVYQPLYYLTLTPIIKFFDFGEGGYKRVEVNPKSGLLRDGQYSQFIHTKDELFFRWNSFQIMIHILRLISSIMAVAIFISAWKVSKYVFKKPLERNLSLLLFFNPMFLHIFTTLTNVVLITLLASLFVAIEIIYSSKKKPLRATFVQGILFGLGIITKISIFGVAFAFLFLFFKRWKDLNESVSSKFKEALVFIMGVLMTSGWYMLRSYWLYGEPLEVNAARPYAGEWHWTLLEKLGFLNFWNSFADTIFRTFWSGYGALTVNFPPVLNLILLLLTLFTIYGVFKFRTRMNEQLKICFYYFLSVFIALVIVNVRTSSMHAKDLFTGYIPLTFLFAFGLINFANFIKRKAVGHVPQLIIPIAAGYFYTRVELVKLIKWFFQSLGIGGFYQPQAVDLAQILMILILKIAVLLIVYRSLIFLLAIFRLNPKTVRAATLFLAISNMVILGVSVYLFYFKFL